MFNASYTWNSTQNSLEFYFPIQSQKCSRNDKIRRTQKKGMKTVCLTLIIQPKFLLRLNTTWTTRRPDTCFFLCVYYFLALPAKDRSRHTMNIWTQLQLYAWMQLVTRHNKCSVRVCVWVSYSSIANIAYVIRSLCLTHCAHVNSTATVLYAESRRHLSIDGTSAVYSIVRHNTRPIFNPVLKPVPNFYALLLFALDGFIALAVNEKPFFTFSLLIQDFLNLNEEFSYRGRLMLVWILLWIDSMGWVGESMRMNTRKCINSSMTFDFAISTFF